MTTFNSNFYQANRNYTREIAEQRLVKLGYRRFEFKGSSFANGASFYFTDESGQEIRVSDHRLTGERAFNTIQIDIKEVKSLPVNFK